MGEQGQKCARVIRVVYDGPGRSGKTTNVEQLARMLGGGPGDRLQVQPAASGRTTLFDWFSFDGRDIAGVPLEVQIVTVPGHKSLERRRAHILRTADTVVLVCDSAAAEQDATREMFDSLREYLGDPTLQRVPVLVQANKQDLPGARSPHELAETLGLAPETTVLAAEALNGLGVRETAVAAIRAALQHTKGRGDGARNLGPSASPDQLRGVLERIETSRARASGAAAGPAELRPTRPATSTGMGRVVDLYPVAVASGPRAGEAAALPRSSPSQVAAATLPAEAPAERARIVPVSAMFLEPNAEAPEPIAPATAIHEAPAVRREHAPQAVATSELADSFLDELLLPTGSSGAANPAQFAAAPPFSDELLPPGRSPVVADPSGDRARGESAQLAAAPSAPPVPDEALSSRESADVASPSHPRAPGESADITIAPPSPSDESADVAGPSEASASSELSEVAATPTAHPGESTDLARPSGDPASSEPSEIAATPAAPASESTDLARPSGDPAPSESSELAAAPTTPIVEIPATPRPDVPPGHVWPIPAGRAALERIASAALAPEGPGPIAALVRAGDFYLRTRPDWRFEAREDGRRALLDHVRRAGRLGALLPADTTIALAVAGEEAGVLWHIVPALRSLGAAIADPKETDLPRRLDQLASAYAAALRLAARESIALELSAAAFAEQDGRCVYVGDRLDAKARASDQAEALLAGAGRASGPRLDAWISALERSLPETLTRDDVAELELERALESAAEQPAAAPSWAFERLRAALERCP